MSKEGVQMKAARITAAAAIIAAIIVGLFTFFSQGSPTINQNISGNGKGAISTGNGDIEQ